MVDTREAVAEQRASDDLRPLAGIRILELGRLYAAPFAVQILADMGADVIKVERPGHGDDFRHYAPHKVKTADGGECIESSNYRSVNRNKRSITVDIRQPQGQRIVKELAKKSDVVVENFKVGTLKKYGQSILPWRNRCASTARTWLKSRWQPDIGCSRRSPPR